MPDGNATGNALVTGAGLRLGREMALYLAGRGYRLGLHYRRSREAAENLAQEIRRAGGFAEPVCADFADEAALSGLVSQTVDALGGPLTVLVNSASSFDYDTFTKSSRDIWDRNMQSNLRAPFVLTQDFYQQAPEPVINAMGEYRAQACIVNLLDQKIRKLTPYFTSYTLAKWGLWGLTQTSAQGLAPKIRVNAIGPGTVMASDGMAEQQFENHRKLSPLKRGASPDEICATLGYFIDSPSVTGQLICVDGGQHIGWVTPEIAAGKQTI